MGWKSRAMALILQTEEDQVLGAMDGFITDVLQRSVDVLIFDGMLVRKLSDGTGISEAELRSCEAHVLQTTGYDIRLSASDL